MSYDKNGLHITEIAYIALNLPEVFDTVQEAINDGESGAALKIAQKAIEAKNRGLL